MKGDFLLTLSKENIIEQIKSFKAPVGFDPKLGMSSNYLNSYLKSWRPLSFFKHKDNEIINFVSKSETMVKHHVTKNGIVIYEPMYPLHELLLSFKVKKSCELKTELAKVKLNKKIEYYLTKLEKENINLYKKYIKSSGSEPKNLLICRIPNLSLDMTFTRKYKDSFCIKEEKLKELIRFNADAYLNRVIFKPRFSHVFTGKIPSLICNLDYKIDSDDWETQELMSFTPQQAISPINDESYIQIRENGIPSQDMYYKKYSAYWKSFNSNFKTAVALTSSKTTGCLFIITLRAFSDEYMAKRFSESKPKKYKDVYIDFPKNIPQKIRQKIKSKIYRLNFKYKFKGSFNFPDDPYDLPKRKSKNTFCITITVNKRTYLDNVFQPENPQNPNQIKKYLDDFFLFLLHFKFPGFT